MAFECFECGGKAKHAHHVVPRAQGGTRTIPLCLDCHARAHYRSRAATSEEVKAGMKRAKEAGIHIGRPRDYDHPQILHLFRAGKTVNEICKMFGISKRQVHRVIDKGDK